MKIALLGAANSGKTVYFSAVYHRYRNVVTWPLLTESKRKQYTDRRIDKQIGFRLHLRDLALEAKLTANGTKLTQRPITDWPESTQNLDKASISVRFDFVPISVNGNSPGLGDAVRSYDREIHIYDPSGGAFTGRHDKAKEITDQLLTCDVAMIFIPADKLLDAESADIDDDEWAGIAGSMALGQIYQLINSIGSRIRPNDVFPLCFVISKSDLLYSRGENSMEFVDKLVYQRILIPLSREKTNFMICGCPISVVDPVTGNFKAGSLEWPFLFAAGGTLMRNCQDLMTDASEVRRVAETAQSKADELLALRRRSWWGRFKRYVEEGTTIGDYQRAALRSRDEAGRIILRAEDDRGLARDIWSSIAVEGREWHGMRVLMNGRDVDDPRVGVV